MVVIALGLAAIIGTASLIGQLGALPEQAEPFRFGRVMREELTLLRKAIIEKDQS